MFDDWSIPLTPEWGDGGELRLKDLIARLVRVEVAEFQKRQSAGDHDRVLSTAQIEAGLRMGRICPEGRKAAGGEIDPEGAVAAAWQAFEDGLYLVVIDEEEFRDLESPVRLLANSRIEFIRLTFLAGA